MQRFSCAALPHCGSVSATAALVLHTPHTCPGDTRDCFAVNTVLLIIASNVCKTITYKPFIYYINHYWGICLISSKYLTSFSFRAFSKHFLAGETDFPYHHLISFPFNFLFYSPVLPLLPAWEEHCISCPARQPGLEGRSPLSGKFRGSGDSSGTSTAVALQTGELPLHLAGRFKSWSCEIPQVPHASC